MCSLPDKYATKYATMLNPYFAVEWPVMQESFCVCTQPMRDDVTMLHCLSLAERMHTMIPGQIRWTDNEIQTNSCLLWIIPYWIAEDLFSVKKMFLKSKLWDNMS